MTGARDTFQAALLATRAAVADAAAAWAAVDEAMQHAATRLALPIFLLVLRALKMHGCSEDTWVL